MNKFFIGCAGVLVIVAILIGVLILETPRFLEAGKAAVKDVMNEEARIAALETAWQPPSPALDEKWFPPTVGDWKLENADAAPGIPLIGLDRPTQTANYRSGRGVIEVSITQASDQEKGELLQKAQEALRMRRNVAGASRGTGVEVSYTRESARLTTTRGNRTYVRIGTGDHTRFWFLKGHLFVFHANGNADSESFPEEFLHASSAQALQ